MSGTDYNMDLDDRRRSPKLEPGFPPFIWPPTEPPRQQRRLKFFRTCYDLDLADPEAEGTITVEVGSPKPSFFHLRREALCDNSDFFRNVMKPVWRGHSDRIISLPDIDPAVFDLYARWIACGASILINEDDWKASHEEYTQWRLELAADKENGEVDPMKIVCPVTVWDFDLTTKAWFLGDFLCSPAFQNHCLGHLYYMNGRFDHHKYTHMWVDIWKGYDVDEAYWQWGTIAYVNVQDILLVWDNTEEHGSKHPLRRFLLDWLRRYWNTYACSDWDTETLDALDRIVQDYPDLSSKVLRGLMSSDSERRCDCMKAIGNYWVAPEKCCQTAYNDAINRFQAHFYEDETSKWWFEQQHRQ